MILLVRHGESEGNADKTVNQYIPNHKVPLTPHGHEQAKLAGQRLKDLLNEDDSICFYTSPYKRTRGTLCEIRNQIKDLGLRQKVYEEPRMREQDFGNFQGTPEEMREIWLERARYGHFFYRIPHGESAADVYDRCASFNETLFRQFSRDDFPSVLVLVTHGIWARVFMQKWFRWSVEYFEDLQNIPHCSWIVMRQKVDRRYTLETKLATWSELNGCENEKQARDEVKDEIQSNSKTDLSSYVAGEIVTLLEEQAKKSKEIRQMFRLQEQPETTGVPERVICMAGDEEFLSSGDDGHNDDTMKNKC